MIKKLFLTLGLAAVMLGGLFIAVAFADGPVFDLDQGDENLRVTGENSLDWLGEVTSGDINDDGIPDLIIGASGYDHDVMTNAGAVYAIWGSADLSGTIDLNSNGQAAGLIIYGGEESAIVGHVVTSGDWNHDGVDDIIIGADGVSNWQGAVYVIDGSSSLPHTLYLTDTTVPYLTVYGQFDGDRLGRAVAIGDVNGDEWQDLIIGAYWADPLSRPRAGTVYVIFGSSEVSGTIDLSAGDEADVTIYGALSEDWTGRWVDYGDVNGDGVQDILIGVSRGDVPGRTDAGKVVVIYGGETISSTTPITIDLATTNVISEGLGLVFYGIDAYDGAGFFVSSGNVNGDTGPQGQSYDDLVVTAFRSGDGNNEDGEAYVIYGGPEITSGVTITSETWGINISDCVDVTIYPGATGDRLGRSVASSDFNGDGYDDVMVGAPRVDRTATITDVGNTYVIYGAPNLSTTINVSPTSNVDILVIGDNAQDESGRACGFGDLNNDDVDDLIIGAVKALSGTGEVYAIWGPKATSITLEPASTIITAGHSVAYSVTATNAYSQSYDATNYLTSYDDDAAAGGTWNGNVYTAGNDGTWTITATHRGLVDTAEIVVDGTAPVITEISVTSDDGSHFYNPGLSADGGTVYFNSLAGEGAGQNLTVAVTMTEANPASLTGGTAFGSTPPADTDGTDGWTVAYTVGTEPGDQTGVPFTVTDQVWLTDQATIDFIEDNTAPAGSVTAPAGGYVTSTQPTFTADASDTGGSGVASVLFQYGLSGTGVYTDVSTDTASPYQAEWGGESLTDGQTYDLRVIVTDNVGNVYTSEAVTVTCDVSAPESNASSPAYTNGSPIAVEWTASDSTSGVANTVLYVRPDGGSWADSGLAPQTGISGTFNYTPPAEGTYYFQTVSTDNAGNQETAPSGDTGTGDDSTIYDVTAPTGSVLAPTGPYVNETQPEFTANADDTASGVASVLFQYGLSGTGVYTDVSTDTASPYQAVWGSESLADGQTYNLRVIVTDNAGNGYTSAVVTVTCDLSMPTMEPIVEAEGQYYNSAPTFSNFGFDDNEALDDGWYQIDSYTTWTALFTDVYTPSWDSDGWIIPGFDGLSEGSHTIYFRARDNVGNEVGTSGEWGWQFYKDTIIPSATVDTPTGTLTNVNAIQGTATDNSGGAGLSKVELQVTDGTNYLQPDGSWSTSEAWLTPGGLENWSYDTSGVNWAEVKYTVHVRAIDRAGNVGTNEGAFTYEAPADPTWYVYLPVVLKSYQ